MWTTILIAAVITPILALVLFNRNKKNILDELKYELVYSYIGFLSVVEDIWKTGKNKTDLPQKTGQVAVITGGLKGIGREVVRLLLKCDMTVVIGCREVSKGEYFDLKMREDGIQSGRLDFRKLDVSSLESVRKFAEDVKTDYPKINTLINNAGIMYVPYAVSPDGFESQFATNYLGHVLLTHLLLNHLIAAGTEEEPARIVNVSSSAHVTGTIDFEDINSQDNYVAYKAYAQSKLALLLFSIYLNGLLKKKGDFVESYAVHPGIVNTELFNETFIKKISPWLLSIVFKPPDKGAVPIVFCAVSPLAKGLGGSYITNCEKKDTNATTGSEDLQEKLFNFTTNLLNIKEFGKV